MSVLSATNHSRFRYIERVLGVDPNTLSGETERQKVESYCLLEKIDVNELDRRIINDSMIRYLQYGNCVISNGWRYIFQENRLVTITPLKRHEFRLRKNEITGNRTPYSGDT